MSSPAFSGGLIEAQRTSGAFCARLRSSPAFSGGLIEAAPSSTRSFASLPSSPAFSGGLIEACRRRRFCPNPIRLPPHSAGASLKLGIKDRESNEVRARLPPHSAGASLKPVELPERLADRHASSPAFSGGLIEAG